MQYWSQLQDHQYVTGAESPTQQAFAAAGFTDPGALVDRSGDAHLFDGGDHGQSLRDLIFRIGIPDSHYTYTALSVTVNMDDGRESLLVSDLASNYYALASSDMVNYSTEAFFTSNDASVQGLKRGLHMRQVQDGAWILHAVANHQGRDWLATVSSTRRLGVLQAVATGKVHFYYGLATVSLAQRDAASNGCEQIEEHCIGAPYEFLIRRRGRDHVSKLNGTSYATPFAFAAYLAAWQRMPAHTHISAVFDLARSCVVDIGEPGPDADTGLGRLDIGCLAYRTTQVPSCHAGHVLVSIQIATCERFSYWRDLRNIFMIGGDETPLNRAFADVGLARRVADRSSNAVFLGKSGAKHSKERILDNLNITATISYRFVPVAANITRDAYASALITEYGRLDDSFLIGVEFFDMFSSDQVQLSGLSSAQVSAGAWMILPVGDLGLLDPVASLATAGKQALLDAAATGKVHFFYGLNDELTGRNHGSNDDLVTVTIESNGCGQIQQYCIGVPYNYFVSSSVWYPGTANSAAFGFAAYLSTWERMPQTVTIGDVFALALSCTEDIGVSRADAQTGRGRLDIGCLAREAYKKNNPSAVLSTAVIARASTSQTQLELSAYMDDFAQGLFADQLGSMSLPGPADARLQLGFAGDSFAGGYRPVQKQAVYFAAPPALHHAILGKRFGLLASGDQAGGYYRIANKLQAGVLAGRGDSFFGATGSGQFEFSCSTDLRLLASIRLRSGSDSLAINGWLGRSRAGCISGRLLDSLTGSEAGIAVVYHRQIGSWRLRAKAWASRFVGGELQVASQRFAIGSGSAAYGGRLQVSYSF